MKRLRSTEKQRDELLQCHPGVGFVVWNTGIGVAEVDVCINRKTKQLCYIATGKPIDLEFYEEE